MLHFVNWFAQAIGEAFRPEAVTPTDVREYRGFLLNVEKRQPATVNRRLAALRRFFQWAKATGLVRELPTENVKGVASSPRAPRWLERAVDETPNIAFDLAKTLIESCCKNVMIDRGLVPGEKTDLPRLLKDTLALLQLTPDGHAHAPEIAEGLRLTAGGLQTAIGGICQIRNREGFASHGKDAYYLPLEMVQAEMVARAADAVVCFLFRVHKGYPTQEPGRRLRYEDNPDFNAYLA